MSGDQEPLDSWWAPIDEAVLKALAEAHGRLTLTAIAVRVGISEDAARSVVTMLAERGKVRITMVELVASRPPLAVAPPRSYETSAPSEERADLRRAP
jgi:predicted ArsR family transcriptional regulator